MDGATKDMDEANHEMKADMNKQTDQADLDKKLKENKTALAALQRASTADLALQLQETKSEASERKLSMSDSGSTADSSEGTMELTDQQKVARHNHLNRYYRSLKGLGPNVLSIW